MAACPGWKEKCALEFHKILWKLLIDARTKDRKKKTKLKKGIKERMLEQDRETIRVHIVGKKVEKENLSTEQSAPEALTEKIKNEQKKEKIF